VSNVPNDGGEVPTRAVQTVPMSTVGLRRRLYALSFIDEFGPVYAVWTLWFNDNGVTTSQISTVFIMWAAVAIAFEIPSGALADRVDRRWLIATAFAIRAVGIATWLVWPTFGGLVVGAALWALHDSLASGAWEAMIRDQLTAVGDERHYARVMARVSQFSNLGIAAGTLLGAGLLRLDIGLDVLGWLTVAAHLGSIGLVLVLPDAGWVATAHDQGGDRSPGIDAWWHTLCAGVRQARSTPVLSRLVVLGALLEGLFLFDEYVPLLSRDRGGADSSAAVIVLVVWIGLLAGGEIAARRPDLRGRTVGTLVLAGSVVTATALLTDPVWTLALFGIGYLVHEVAWIPTDARLQERADPVTRATVTSVRAFGSATVAMLFFALVATMSDGDDPTPGLLTALLAIVVTGVLLVAWLPDRLARAPRRDEMAR
jgi:MFS family permease